MALQFNRHFANASSYSESWLLDNLGFVFFLGILGMIYISNTHYSERKIREIQTLQQEIRQIRFNYMAQKADLMYKCKQSEIANMADGIGLDETTVRPKKIVIDKNGGY